MSYHVSILRTAGGQQIPITISEFQSVVSLAPEHRFEVEKAQASIFETGEEVLTLWWTQGVIWSKNPSDKGLELMLRLSSSLNARVRGDELETYRSVGDWYVHPDDTAEKSAAKLALAEMKKRTRRRQWLLNLSIAAVFVLLGTAAAKCSAADAQQGVHGLLPQTRK